VDANEQEKRAKHFFEIERVRSQCKDNLIFFVHPELAAKGKKRTTVKLDLAGVTGMNIPLFLEWVNFRATTLEIKKRFLEGLWVPVNYPRTSMEHLFDSECCIPLIIQAIEKNEDLWQAYAQLVTEGFTPKLPLISQKKRELIASIVAGMEVNINEKEEDMETVDLNLIGEELVGYQVATDSMRPGIIRTYAGDQSKLFDMYDENREKAFGPSDRIAWDLAPALVFRRKQNIYYSAKKLGELDANKVVGIKTTLEADPHGLLLSRLGREWEDEDKSILEMIFCLYDYGGPFRDLADQFILNLYLVRQAWRVPRQRINLDRSVDPCLVAPTINYFSCVTSAGSRAPQLSPYVSYVGVRVTIRVPRTWIGHYVFVNRLPSFPASVTRWPEMAPIIEYQDEEYVTISMQRLKGSYYIICATVDFELIGVIQVPTESHHYSYHYTKECVDKPSIARPAAAVFNWRIDVQDYVDLTLSPIRLSTIPINAEYGAVVICVKMLQGWMLWNPMMSGAVQTDKMPRIRVSGHQFTRVSTGTFPKVTSFVKLEGHDWFARHKFEAVLAPLDPPLALEAVLHGQSMYARTSWFMGVRTPQEMYFFLLEHVMQAFGRSPAHISQAYFRLRSDLSVEQRNMMFPILKMCLLQVLFEKKVKVKAEMSQFLDATEKQVKYVDQSLAELDVVEEKLKAAENNDIMNQLFLEERDWFDSHLGTAFTFYERAKYKNEPEDTDEEMTEADEEEDESSDDERGVIYARREESDW
jgi:hypothetical protein